MRFINSRINNGLYPASGRMLHFVPTVIKVSKLLLLLQYGVYFAVLLGVYIFFISPVYAYMGFVNTFNFDNLLFSILILLLVAPLISPGSLPSNFFLNLAIAIILTPTLVLYTAASLPHWYALTTAFAIILVALTAKISLLPPVRIAFIPSARIMQFLLLFSVSVVGAIFLFGGARYLNFNLAAVYDFRREAAQNLPGIFAYISPLVGKVVIPFGLVFAFRDRRWFFVALFSVLSFLFFGLTAHKSLIFYPILVIFVYQIAGSRYLVQYFLLSLITILLVSGIDVWFLLNGAEGLSGWFTSLFTRRAVLVPSLLNWYYLDFFSNADKYFWADSKVTFGLVKSPFDLRVAHLIGWEFFNKEGMSANTGWIGSGYANAGIWGVMLYSVAIGALFALLDSYANRLGTRMVVSLFTLPVFTLLTSTDLLTMLLTHGLFFSIVLLAMINPTTQFKK